MSKKIRFDNIISPFTISGVALVSKEKVVIDEIHLNASHQMCSTEIDFYPKWKVRNKKLVLELIPKWVTADDEEKEVIFDVVKTMREE